MPALRFPSPDLLRLALAAGILPPSIARRPVRAGWDNQNQVWIEVPAAFPPETLAALARLGITLHGTGAGTTPRPYLHWAALVPLQPEAAGPKSGFALVEAADHELARLAGQLRRLGAPPVELQLPPGARRGWLVGVPVPYLLALGLDDWATDAPEVFREQAPGVWVLAGWSHPLPESLLAPPDGIVALLRPGRDWQLHRLEPPEARSDSYLLRPSQPGVRWVECDPTPLPGRLRLVRSPDLAEQPETLWVLPGPPYERIAELASEMDERIIRQLRFAVVQQNGTVRTLVLADPEKGRQPLPYLGLPGYVAHSRIPNLYLPRDQRLNPPLRPQRVRELFALEPDHLAWIEPRADGQLLVQRTPLAALRPAQEWIDYRAEQPQRLAVGWQPSDLLSSPRFNLEIEPLDSEAAGQPTLGRSPIPKRPSASRGPGQETWIDRVRQRLRRARKPIEKSAPVDAVHREGDDRITEKLLVPDGPTPDWAQRRAELEERVIRDLPGLAPPDRAAIWAELGELYSAVGNFGDAALCWLNAVWDTDSLPARWITRWLGAEARRARIPSEGQDPTAILAASASPQTARVAAAYLAWQGLGSSSTPRGREHLPALLALLKAQGMEVPTRAVWLAQLASARLTEGDSLGLARCRDQLFARLTEVGLRLDLDAPAFFRFRDSAGPERWTGVRDWLGRIRDPIQRWLNRMRPAGRLQWAGLDPEQGATAAYADLLLAWGLSKLGDRSRARELEAQADRALSRCKTIGADPTVHRILRAAFAVRIQAALEARPNLPGLPLEAASELLRLDDLGRYAVDKLRARCQILEPIDLINPYRGRDLGGFLGSDPLGDRLQRFLARPDLAPDPAVVGELVTALERDPTAHTVPRVTFALLQLAPRLDPAAAAVAVARAAWAVELLPEWVRIGVPGLEPTAAVQRFGLRILVGASHAATLFHLVEALRSLTDTIHQGASGPPSPLLRVVGACAERFFRTLRRVGLTETAENLLQALDRPEATEAHRLGLAIGQFTAGNEAEGIRLLDATRERLFVTGIPDLRERTATALAYAGALGHAPPRITLGRLEELFLRLDGIAVHGATNRYFTLQPLELIDTVVRAVVSDDFTLGQEVRRWLDDDEYLIRRRVNRELTQALQASGWVQ